VERIYRSLCTVTNFLGFFGGGGAVNLTFYFTVLYAVAQKANSNVETYIDSVYGAVTATRFVSLSQKFKENSFALLDVSVSEGVSMKWRQYS
jgi:hypothetical protein